MHPKVRSAGYQTNIDGSDLVPGLTVVKVAANLRG